MIRYFDKIKVDDLLLFMPDGENKTIWSVYSAVVVKKSEPKKDEYNWIYHEYDIEIPDLDEEYNNVKIFDDHTYAVVSKGCFYTCIEELIEYEFEKE